MGVIKRWLGLEAPVRGTRPAPAATAAGPLELGPGRMVCLDPSLKLLLAGHSHVVLPGDEKVWARGHIDLGQGMGINRYYLDDEDYFVQVVMNGPGADDIEEIILFGYFAATPVASQAELLRLTGPQSPIGLPTYEHDGEVFMRQWGSEAGQTEFVPLEEFVTSPEASYRVEHLAMLYAREVGLANRREFLLFSVEEDEAGNVSLTTAVGVSLQPTDIKVL
ncbi:DUF2491 family protein [Pseudomonas typographi]|uniref:YjfK family protein n=1 Tax=Pseudomonas typographi TaxID=2715964 RepID=A0ABR7Z1M2_9PSED|nr:DUF2491 family protein [Pseudomonas typographi]MBD1554617.1 YjfK family protein [Pseudomonas typographi]MBD1589734.1 YjfK family protein [Pseudomonas typographi]MBD1599211.1 YjfK family protein [Pseudomonas typographi]